MSQNPYTSTSNGFLYGYAPGQPNAGNTQNYGVPGGMTPAMMMANMGRPMMMSQGQPPPPANAHQQYQQQQQQYQYTQYTQYQQMSNPANYGQQMAYNVPTMPGMMQMPMMPPMMVMPPQSMGNVTNIQGMVQQQGMHAYRMNEQQAPQHQKNGKRGGNKNNGASVGKYGPSNSTGVNAFVPTEACPTKKELKALKRAENLKEVQMYCENCEKELKTMEAWDAHLKTHEKCPQLGCDFVATRKVVDTHYKNVHAASSITGAGAGGATSIDTVTGYKTIDVEGQKFRVLFGSTESEIKQWREARKKKFPTSGNVAAKEEAKRKAVEAGTLDVVKNKGRKKQKTEEKIPGDDVEDAPPETNESASDGTIAAKSVGESDHVDKKADHVDKKADHVDKDHKTEVRDGETDTIEVNDPIEHVPAASTSDQRDTNAASNETNTKKRKQYGSNKLHLPKPLGGGTKGTLLKKLLEDEIDKESNIALQCFRFFSANNYWL